MKYMDDVQTVDEAIEWFRLFRKEDIRYTGDIERHKYTSVVSFPGGVEYPMNTFDSDDEIITLVYLAQWQRYAEKLRELLHQATGQPYDTTVWESCNEE